MRQSRAVWARRIRGWKTHFIKTPGLGPVNSAVRYRTSASIKGLQSEEIKTTIRYVTSFTSGAWLRFVADYFIGKRRGA